MVAVKRKQLDSPNLITSWDRMMAGWQAGVRNRHYGTPEGIPADSSSGDWHYQNEHEYLRTMEIVRHHERNDPVVNAALNRLTSNVCQNGFTVDPQSDDRETDERLLQDWMAWSTNPVACDRRARLPFNQIAELAFRSTVRDGDGCVVPMKSGTLKYYEAHRLRTPTGTRRNVVHGILLDDHRRPVEYWFTREPIDPLSGVQKVGEMHRFKAFDSLGRPQVFHVARPTRESQARGVSWMAPSISTAVMHNNIEFAKMVQQQTVSCYSLINDRSAAHYRPEDAEADASGKKPTRDEYLQSLVTPLEDLVPGMIYDSLPGERLTGFSPNVPNAEFFEHATLMLTFMAINLDMPVAVLLLDPKRTNFSGWRGAIDQARISWRSMQRWLISQLHKPVYEWWVRRKLATEPWLREKFESGVDVLAHDWKAPAWDYIEPEKDAKADAMVVGTGMGSRRQRLARRGDSYDEVMPAIFAELKSELMACVDVADEVNRAMQGKNAGRPLDVREIAIARGVLPNPNPTTLSSQLDETESTQQQEAA